MNSSDQCLDKQEILNFIKKAKTLRRCYEIENRRNPKQRYEYGSVDEVALRLFERSNEVIVIDIKLCDKDLKIHCQDGRIEENGAVVYTKPQISTYIIKNYKSTTISRFGRSICDVLSKRATNGPLELKALMPNTTVNHSRRTKSHINVYTNS